MKEKQIKLLKISYKVSIISTVVLFLAVLYAMLTPRYGEQNFYVSGGFVFVFFFLLNTYPRIKSLFLNIEADVKPLSVLGKIVGGISIINGGLITLVGIFVFGAAIISIFTMNFLESMLGVCYGVFLLSYGVCLCYYTYKTFKLL